MPREMGAIKAGSQTAGLGLALRSRSDDAESAICRRRLLANCKSSRERGSCRLGFCPAFDQRQLFVPPLCKVPQMISLPRAFLSHERERLGLQVADGCLQTIDATGILQQYFVHIVTEMLSLTASRISPLPLTASFFLPHPPKIYEVKDTRIFCSA
ncbi:unnamed protein product [Ixodes persulcatus]